MAPAAVPAGTVHEVRLGRHAAQFKGLADVAVDGFLDLLEFILGVEEAAGYRVAEELVALALEIGDLLPGQRHRGLLFLLERLAFRNDTVILGAGSGVSQEGIDALANRAHVRLLQDRLAQFLGFPQDRGLFD